MLGRRYLGILKVNLHGYTRFTKDLDLLIDLGRARGSVP